MPASAGFFGEARDASRSLGAALKGEALKMLEGAKKRNVARRASKAPGGPETAEVPQKRGGKRRDPKHGNPCEAEEVPPKCVVMHLEACAAQGALGT